MDAWVLVQIAEQLSEKGKLEGKPVENYIKPVEYKETAAASTEVDASVVVAEAGNKAEEEAAAEGSKRFKRF